MMPKRKTFIGVKGYKRRVSPRLRRGLTLKQRIMKFINTIKVKRILAKEKALNRGMKNANCS